MKADFSEAVHRYGDTVYKIAYLNSGSQADAEDIFQETFFALYKSGKEFTDQNHLKAWLIRVAVNKSKMLRRSAWFRNRTELSGAEAAAEPSYEKDNRVFEAVTSLKEKYRTAVFLFYYEGYTCEEIGRILKVNPSTVRTRLARAREILRKELKEEWKNE